MIGISFVQTARLLALYEGLSRQNHRLTTVGIRGSGIINKRLRRIPLRYVRDVTFDQNLFQRMFGISSITVSPTNGDKIVLSNISNGEGTREIIWELIASHEPQSGQRR